MLRRRFLYQLKSGIPTSQIWYTTTDNSPLQSSANSAFETTALSTNVYSGGKGVLTYLSAVTSVVQNMFRKLTKLATMQLPASVTTIENYAYNGCSALQEIAIPASVTKLGNEAFSGCTSLQEITLPNGVQTIGNYAFLNCTSLSKVTIPGTMISIGNEAFSGCSALRRVDISDLSAWCRIAFTGYRSNPLFYANALYLVGTKIESLTIPDDITALLQYCFRACESIKSLNLNKVKTIGNYAFMACKQLKKIDIPDSVTSIGGSAFENCSNVYEIYCRATTPPTITSNTFSGVSAGCVFYVPASALKAYQSASVWSSLLLQSY